MNKFLQAFALLLLTINTASCSLAQSTWPDRQSSPPLASASPAYFEARGFDCPSCRGIGKQTCEYCKGLDLTTQICDYCQGHDLTTQTCTYCKGTDQTKFTCTYCKGIDQTTLRCDYCKGQGASTGHRCVFCHGSGKCSRCVFCHGSGKQARCVFCHGAGKQARCVFCHGSGTKSRCVFCHGKAAANIACITCLGDGHVERITATPASEIHPVAENDSYYGEISDLTGRPKTVFVQGYYRKDGTYVRSHYRSLPGDQPAVRGPPLIADGYDTAPFVAENGSYYGQPSELTGRPKTVHVGGYHRKDGTYVRGHYRSKPRR